MALDSLSEQTARGAGRADVCAHNLVGSTGQPHCSNGDGACTEDLEAGTLRVNQSCLPPRQRRVLNIARENRHGSLPD